MALEPGAKVPVEFLAISNFCMCFCKFDGIARNNLKYEKMAILTRKIFVLQELVMDLVLPPTNCGWIAPLLFCKF